MESSSRVLPIIMAGFFDRYIFQMFFHGQEFQTTLLILDALNILRPLHTVLRDSHRQPSNTITAITSSAAAYSKHLVYYEFSAQCL